MLWALVVTLAIVVFGGGAYSLLSRLLSVKERAVMEREQLDAVQKEFTLLHSRVAETRARAEEALRAAARAESASNVRSSAGGL
jgi:hypothetical protein